MLAADGRHFSSAGSHDPDPGDSIRFEWDFDGNGTVDSVEPNPTHTYTTRGVYTAKLRVIDSNGDGGSANTTITVGNTSPTVNITVPTEGGTFAFGNNIPFTVTVIDPEDGAINCANVQVTFVLGHDTHGHAEATTNGCSGVLPTDAADVSHGGNVFGVISASYTDTGGTGGVPALTTVDQNQIRQKRQEVEFAVNQSGTNTAASTDVGGGLQRGGLGAGDWIELNGPFDLLNINSITFRMTGGTDGAAPERSRSGGMRSTPPAAGRSCRAVIAGTATRPPTRARPSRSWTRAAHTGCSLCSRRRRRAREQLFNLNWVEFVGAGVGTP